MISEINLTAEEVAKLRSVPGRALVLGPAGEVIGIFNPSRPLDDLDRKVMKKVRDRHGNFGETRSTAQVLDRLKQLENRERPE